MNLRKVKKIRHIGAYLLFISFIILPFGILTNIIILIYNEDIINGLLLMVIPLIGMLIGYEMGDYCPNKRIITYCDYEEKGD